MLDVGRLESLIDLELGAAHRLTRVIVTIGAEDRVELAVERDGSRRTGTVDVRSASDAERTIALYVGELARNAERSAPPAPPPAPQRTPIGTGPPSIAGGGQTESPSRLRAHVLAAMGGRWMIDGGALMLTPHLEGGVVWRDDFRFGALARYGYASADDRIGSVSAHHVSGGLAATVRFVSTESFEAWTGPRAELGFVTAKGRGTGESSASSVSFAGTWTLEARAVFGSIAVVGSLDLGWMGHGLELRADDRTILRLSGPFIGANAGFALR